MPTSRLTQTALSLRPCMLSISNCLNLNDFNFLTGQEIDNELYNFMVDECERGPYDIVRNLTTKTNYKNNACARCNGEEESCECFSPVIRNEIPTECAPTLPTIATVQPLEAHPQRHLTQIMVVKMLVVLMASHLR